ncbi:serine protease [Variovorax sp. SG517]|uniref:S1 family peptidase n=1 Tax=unclassified Variovorax TaxID=663243 RepID=UPI00159D2A58|nr:serine protease [Variovorax sp. SG517]NVM88480.1 hypothetical protein [Variovorax sp. SG517]
MAEQRFEPQMFSRAADVMTHYVIPLYIDNWNGLPEQVGTAFLVQLGPADYLVSAAHVLDLRSEGRLYFYSGSNIRTEVLGQLCHSGKNVPRDQDNIDVAVVRLAPGTPRPPYREIERLAFEIHELRPRLLPRIGRDFAVLGFPSSKNEFRRAHGEIRAKAYAYFGHSADESVYSELNLPTQDHLLLNFDRKSGINAQKEAVVFPKPQGMSGGPIWQFHSEDENDFRFGFPVVGVAVAHKERQKLLQGTDISFALQAIGILQTGG